MRTSISRWCKRACWDECRRLPDELLSRLPEALAKGSFACVNIRPDQADYLLVLLNERKAPEDLLAAVKTVLSGRAYLSRDIAQAMDDRESADSDPLGVLSAREFEIFCRLAEGQSATQVAEILNVSVKTVANHRLSVLKKLRARNVVDLTRLAIRYDIIKP